METIIKTILTGIGATLSLDLWASLLRLLNIKSLDYRFVGRWVGHFPEGKFFHKNIMTAPPIRNEVFIGWAAHYTIGISFACLLVLLYGKYWLDEPTFYPAVFIGIVTSIAPFFVMQPAFGFGIASSKLPHSNLLRLKSLLTHSVYGIGLYITALFLTEIW
jgi:hypothetical protein